MLIVQRKRKTTTDAARDAATTNTPDAVQPTPLPWKTAMQRLGGRTRDANGIERKGQWLPHDRATGKSAARRRKQMERGILPRMCTSCGVQPVATVHVDLCDGCLERQFT